MDQTMKGFGRPFGSPDVIGGGIDDPDAAQPSIARDEREAGGDSGSMDAREPNPLDHGQEPSGPNDPVSGFAKPSDDSAS